MQQLTSLTALDAAIEQIQRPLEDQVDAAHELIDLLLDGAGLIEPIASVDVRLSALLQIAAIDSDLLYNHNRRREVLDFIQNRVHVIGSSVLSTYNIDRRTQADQICQQLGTFFPDAISEYESALQSYDGVGSLRVLQNKLLEALNKPLARATIRPMLQFDSGFLERLQGGLKAAVHYSTASADEAAATLDQATQIFADLNGSLAKHPNSVSRLLFETTEKLRSDIQDHFQASPFSKPAKLSLKATSRRYPLHIPNLNLSIPMELHNEGKGIAIDAVLEMTGAIGVNPCGSPLRISNVPSGSTVIEFQAETNPEDLERNPDDTGGQDIRSALCQFQLAWVNSDGSDGHNEQMEYIPSQNPEIDWIKLNQAKPYSLEAVTTEEDLIGRESILDRAVSVLGSANTDSLYIHGQRRVGKTSLANVAGQRLTDADKVVYISLDIGDIYNSDPALTVDNLAEELISEIVDGLNLPEDLKEVKSDGSLVPLVRLLKKAATPDLPIVIALDEFDQLPSPLFGRTSEQNAFFSTIRSISRIKGVGIVLIGGEQMKIIIAGPPGVKLNKFTPFQVDYLDWSTQKTEFEELVRGPTKDDLEFTSEACHAIYELTAGNPYYTKLLCRQLLESAIQRRDAFIDVREVEAATELLLSTLEANSFSHYWEDFLHEEDRNRDVEVVNRKRCLVALGLTWASGESATTEAIEGEASSIGLDYTAVRRELSDFASRGILVEKEGQWRPRVNLFGRWLANRGPQEIVSSTELASAEGLVAERESLRVTYDELQDLATKWGMFRHTSIWSEQIRDYLLQFGDTRSQRLIFEFLKNIRFVNQIDEYAFLKSSFERIQQHLKNQHGQWKKSQIKLSYTGSKTKSSFAMAGRFLDANRPTFRRGEWFDRRDLCSLAANGMTDVIVVDDFVGSGDTLTEDLEDLHRNLPPSVTLHIVLLAGTSDGVDRISQFAEGLFESPIFIHCMFEIPKSPNIFDSSQGVYPDDTDARDALQLVREFGMQLMPNAPLGYGDCCAPIVFARTIPNNAPPILWKQTSDFVPLFPRNS